jgi:hypothetical protein
MIDGFWILILVLCMFANKTMSFFLFKIWSGLRVVLLGSWWMFLVFFILFVFDLCFLSFFLCFYVFFMFNLFLFCFGLFSGQTIQVKSSRIKTGSIFYTLFVFFFPVLRTSLLWAKAQSQFTLLVNNDLVEWFCFLFYIIICSY